ncbi:MAG: class I SAM-dependent methyltransferase [Candidatus Woesearchaeota archaeon]|nr:class I SAM-dependent methyltransferase [Candidatus Woesearchaeota archaeon]
MNILGMIDSQHDAAATADLYDDLWNDLREEDFAAYKSRLRKILPSSVYSGKICLDGGCGQGAISSMMSEKAKRLYSVDISRKALEITRKRLANPSNVVLKRASLLELPFENDYFDAVVSNGVIHHTTNPVKALSELERVLKRKKTIILGIYGKTGLIRYIIEAASFILKRVPYRIVKWVLEKAGFSPLSRYYVLDYIYVPIRKRFSIREITSMMKGFSCMEIKSDYPEGMINRIIYGTNYFYITAKKR